MLMMDRRIAISEDMIRPQLLTLREFRPFKTSDEYLWAMKEDLSDWLNLLYPELSIRPNAFMECLETGVTLCKHANNVRKACLEWISTGKKLPKCWGLEWKLPTGEVILNSNARPETFFARDNVHNFITWCRKLGIFECLLFESDDLIMRKNEKNVILCLLEVARRGSHFGMATPLLVQFEKEIDRDIAKDTGQDLSSSSGEEEESFLEYGPTPQIITNDLRSLDEMVRDLVERCSCPTQFPMIRVAEGKYRIGNTKVMIYVRILRNHVMVRVGGGWDTLAHYLDKHDPCRCSSGHRVAVSSRLIMKTDSNAPRMKVEYDRRDLSFDAVAQSTPTHFHHGSKKPGNGTTDLSDSSSEISDEGYKTSDQSKLLSSGITNGCETNGHHSRKSSISRARSLSTDEDRPDSRSTDEEIVVQTPVQRERPILKSSSTGKVPRTYARSISCERTRDRTPTTGNVRQPQGQQQQQRPKHPPVTRSNLQKGPTRSLSAGGTTEFFGNRLDFPGSRYSKVQVHRPNGTNTNGMRTPGKNTWNGPNGVRPRERPNLFHANFFNSPNQGNNSTGGGRVENNIITGHGGEGGLIGPNLAEWIKKALEHESDADKISHIELAIKQFEDCHHQKTSPTDIQQGVSLPYNANSSTELSLSSSSPNSSQTIRRRKENGVSKIPKPNFY